MPNGDYAAMSDREILLRIGHDVEELKTTLLGVPGDPESGLVSAHVQLRSHFDAHVSDFKEVKDGFITGKKTAAASWGGLGAAILAIIELIRRGGFS